MNTIILFALLFIAMAVLIAWSELNTFVFEEGRSKDLKWYTAYYSSSIILWPVHLLSAIFDIFKGKIFRQEKIGWWAWAIFSLLLAIKISWFFVGPTIFTVPLVLILLIVFFVVSVVWFILLAVLFSIIPFGDRILNYLFPESNISVS